MTSAQIELTKRSIRTLKREYNSEALDSDDGSESCRSMITVSSNPDSGSNRDAALKRSYPEGEDPSDSDSSFGSDLSRTSLSRAHSKRGRGRPPTTGEYVGLAKAKEALAEAERRQMEVEAEREIRECGTQMRTRREQRLADPLNTGGEKLASSLSQQVADSLNVVLKVATKSKNLKGTSQRELKDAVAAIKEAVGELAERSVSEETAKLTRANERLRAELADLRREFAEWRDNIAQSRTRESPTNTKELPPPRPPETEELVRTVMTQVGFMLNARLEGLEERLLPAKRHRPPLAGDRKVVTPAPGPAPVAGSTATKKAQTEKAKKGKKKPKSMAAAEAAARTEAPRDPQTVASTAVRGDWATVVKRGKAKSANGAKGSGQAKPAPKKAPKKKKAIKLRPPPTTSAVVLTLQPGAADRGVDYSKVLWEARGKVNIHELGVAPLSIRSAITGGRMLIIQDDPKGEKAKVFAQKLRDALREDDVRVTRPEKCVDIRISGLDDSTTAADVLAAVAREGDCHKDSLKSGEIRRGRSGLGTVWVRCPVGAARKLATSGRLLVGWASATVNVVPPKQMRCYRCLNSGHASATCSSPTDRSRQCFRCGEEGHRATQCKASAPHCMLCAAAEKPAGHKLWSKACAASSSSKTKRKAAAKPPRAPKASGPPREAMET